jgi:hypothetical protein
VKDELRVSQSDVPCQGAAMIGPHKVLRSLIEEYVLWNLGKKAWTRRACLDLLNEEYRLYYDNQVPPIGLSTLYGWISKHLTQPQMDTGMRVLVFLMAWKAQIGDD